MIVRLALSVALFAGTATAVSAGAPGLGTERLCFSRTYDAAHLQAHPGQATRSVVAAFHEVALDIRIEGTNGKRFISAGCDWAAQAGRDIKDKPLLPIFKGATGYDCIVTYAASSAEEGGYLILEPAADGQSVTLYLQSPIAARPSAGGKAVLVPMGIEDRVFRLKRAPAATCAGLGLP